MYGGQLLTTNIYLSQSKNQLLTAYGSTFYLFAQQQTALIGKIKLHQNPILHFQCFEHQSSLELLSIDKTGKVYKLNINYSKLFKSYLQNQDNCQIDNWSVKKQHQQIEQAYILNSNSLLYIFKGTLFVLSLEKNKKCTTESLGQYSKIYSYVKNYSALLKIDENFREIHIYSHRAKNIIYSYNCQKIKGQITCAQLIVRGLVVDLAIGTSNGKIFLIRNISLAGDQLNQQHPCVKLQWHLHAIHCLKSVGNFLYSGGQEGTLVTWQLNEAYQKDFLPRFGSQILNIFSNGSTISGLLSDNTIKSITLDQQRMLKHYKIIVNPRPYRFIEVPKNIDILCSYNKLKDQLCMLSSPGRLQFLQFSSGINEQFQIIQRNHVGRLDNCLPIPHKITKLALDSKWQNMAVVVQGINHCSLRIYKYSDKWEQIGKIVNPHKNKILSLISMQVEQKTIFATLSQEQATIKLWKQFKELKQSLLQADQQYWNCYYQIAYRGKIPIHISALLDYLVVTYQGQVVIYNIKNRSICQQYAFKNIKLAILYETKVKKMKNKSSQSNYCLITIDHTNKCEIRMLDLDINLHTLKQSSQKVISLNFKSQIQKIDFQDCNVVFHSLCDAQANTRILHFFDLSTNELKASKKIGDFVLASFWYQNSASNDYFVLTENDLMFHSVLRTVSDPFLQNKGLLYSELDTQSQATKNRELQADRIDTSTLENRWLEASSKKRINQKQFMKNSLLNSLVSMGTSFDIVSNQLLL